MGIRDCYVGSSQGKRRRHVLIAQQCNHSAERQRRVTFLSTAEEVAIVKTLSLRCFQRIEGSVTRPSLRLNLC
jgi:hypothetical protein